MAPTKGKNAKLTRQRFIHIGILHQNVNNSIEYCILCKVPVVYF